MRPFLLSIVAALSIAVTAAVIFPPDLLAQYAQVREQRLAKITVVQDVTVPELWILMMEDITANDGKPYIFQRNGRTVVFPSAEACDEFRTGPIAKSVFAQLQLRLGVNYKLGEPTCVPLPDGNPA